MIYAIIGAINFIVMIGLILYFVHLRKKKSYAIILNKEGEAIDSFKINPSYDEIKHKYDGNAYTYIKPKGTTPIKFQNLRFYLYEFNKPNPLNMTNEDNPNLYADVFNELLEMAKIKALNKPESTPLDLFNKKNIFIGLIVIVGILVLLNGGI
jgi:hypothetical protein